MDIRLDPVTPERKRAFAQLINLYNFNYDFTNYLNDDIPEEGFFWGDADYYMSNEKAQNFFIRVDGKIAGYAVIMTGDCHYLEDAAAHSIDEFFVTRKYRRMGVGTTAALQAFRMFPGRWEVCHLDDSVRAQAFWNAVIGAYTDGNYRTCAKENDDLVGIIFDNSSIK